MFVVAVQLKAPTRTTLIAAHVLAAIVVGLGACTFDPSPIAPSGSHSGAAAIGSDGLSDASTPGSDASNAQSRAGQGGAGSDGKLAAGTGGASGAGNASGTGGQGGASGTSGKEALDAALDAGDDGTDASMPDSGGATDASDPEPMNDADVDGSEPGCDEPIECVCAHDRLETPDDECAAPDCPLADCAPDDECGFKRYDDSVYYFCADARAQEDAVERCERVDGMHVVKIDDAEEDAFVIEHIEGKVWIGAVEAPDDTWHWLDGTTFFDETTAEPVDGAYANWDTASDEPNDLGAGTGIVECAILWDELGAWADTNCPAMNGYVCEREL